MGDFVGFICGVFLVAFATVWLTEYNINAEESIKFLNEVCAKNSGIKSTKISIDTWKFQCTDGAVFVIDRKGKQ